MPVETHIKVASDTTNATSVEAAPVTLTAWMIANLSQGAIYYLKLYDKASAPTVGTDVPVLTIGVPPLSATHEGLDDPVEFENGLALAMTTGPSDADTGALPTANLIVSNLVYDA